MIAEMWKVLKIAPPMFAGIAVLASSSNAQNDFGVNPETSGFQQYLSIVRAKAISEGVRPATIDRAFANISYNERVISLDRSQPETDPAAQDG